MRDNTVLSVKRLHKAPAEIREGNLNYEFAPDGTGEGKEVIETLEFMCLSLKLRNTKRGNIKTIRK